MLSVNLLETDYARSVGVEEEELLFGEGRVQNVGVRIHPC